MLILALPASILSCKNIHVLVTVNLGLYCLKQMINKGVIVYSIFDKCYWDLFRTETLKTGISYWTEIL